ncbi:hypothetical protein GCM10008932_07390 [Alkalibacterium iburiense]|uniref:Uncharacterized protein n=1 Tax=Alkalibacterium iburiense TaxID=290589 RepID=A0ABP3GYD8_9LACT
MKFQELRTVDKQKRYRYIVMLPSLFLLITLLSYEAHYALFTSILSLTMIIDLFFVGILNNKKNYNYTYFLMDSLTLILITLLSILIISPMVISLLSRLTSLTIFEAHSYWTYVVSSPLLVYLLWYLVIKAQKKTYRVDVNWKWKASTIKNLNFNENDFE